MCISTYILYSFKKLLTTYILDAICLLMYMDHYIKYLMYHGWENSRSSFLLDFSSFLLDSSSFLLDSSSFLLDFSSFLLLYLTRNVIYDNLSLHWLAWKSLEHINYYFWYFIFMFSEILLYLLIFILKQFLIYFFQRILLFLLKYTTLKIQSCVFQHIFCIASKNYWRLIY